MAESPIVQLVERALTAFRHVDEYASGGDIARLRQAHDSWNVLLRTPFRQTKWLLEATNVALLLNYATDAVDDDERVVQQLMAIGGSRPVTRTEAIALNNLGCVLIRRFERSGQLSDLAYATDALGWAGAYLHADSVDDPLEGAVRMNLGVASASAYRQSGQIEHLDEAIQWLNAAIEVQSPSDYAIEVLLLDGPDPSYPLLLARDLYNIKAPDALEQLKAKVNQSLVTTAIFTTCAALHRERSRHRPVLEDLGHFRDLLEHYRDWLEQLHPWVGSSSARRSLLAELGKIYRVRFETTGDTVDLDAAIMRFDEAIDPVFGYAPGRLRRVAELADSLLKRYELRREDSDLDRATLALRLALAQTGPEVPQRAAPLRWWAQCLRLQYRRSGWTKDRANAVAAYQEAIEVGLISSPGEALAAALDWGRWASSQGSWLEASGAYKHALDALDLLYQRQLLRASKETWLTETQGLASEAAYVIARSGDPSAAVEALERARSRLTSEALARRGAELQQRLDAAPPELRNCYLSIVTYIERLELGVVPKVTLNDVKAARAELDAILLQLDPNTDSAEKSDHIAADRVCEVAQRGTIAYIVSAMYGSLALIVRPTNIESLFLAPRVQDVDKLIGIANNRLSSEGYLSHLEDPHLFPSTLAKALDQLGSWFMTSIARHLNASEADTTARGPVVLIPVGRLALFPLHAARCEIDGKLVYFLEHFEVLTAPSASVRAAALAAAERPGPQRLLVIGNPTTDNATPLRYAETEAQAVAKLFGTHATLLSGLDATVAEVEALLPQSGVAHFACHGRFDPTNPLDSELLLANRTTLRARKVMERSADLFESVRLVVMSACRTSVTDYLALPDEVLGLSSSFLYAGIPAVVGSLWPVDDAATSRLMIAFYRYLMEPNATPTRALRQAQLDALKGTLSSVLQTQFQEASELAEMRDAFRAQSEFREIASDDPYYWAGFIMSGASEIILV